MGHKIAEGIIENGQLLYIDKPLPEGKIKVHLIYDTLKEASTSKELAELVRCTYGIYKDVDAKNESLSLCENWERTRDRGDFKSVPDLTIFDPLD